MVAVGYGGFPGAPAIWLLPVVFPLVMAFGGALGVLGMPLPGVETGIAFVSYALGAMVALAESHRCDCGRAGRERSASFHGHAFMAPSFHRRDALPTPWVFRIHGMFAILGGIARDTLSIGQPPDSRASRRLCHCPVRLRFLGHYFI